MAGSDAGRAADRRRRRAAAVGALLAGEVPLAGRRVGVILSGRNVDLKIKPGSDHSARLTT